MASYQYSYVMKNLTKSYPGGRDILKGVTLSFLPNVKIGVLGVNGAGKSTLLKIMAGRDTEFGGEAWAAEGVRVQTHERGEGGNLLLSPVAILVLLRIEEDVASTNGALHFQAQRKISAGLLGRGVAAKGGGDEGDDEGCLHGLHCSFSGWTDRKSSEACSGRRLS